MGPNGWPLDRLLMVAAWVVVGRLVVVKDVVRLEENRNGVGVIWLGFDKISQAWLMRVTSCDFYVRANTQLPSSRVGNPPVPAASMPPSSEYTKLSIAPSNNF